MNVNEWGPGGWVFLHTTTFNYPLNPCEEDKQLIKKFFDSVKNILPCKYCRDSFKIYTKYIPVDSFLDDREGLTYLLSNIESKSYPVLVELLFVL